MNKDIVVMKVYPKVNDEYLVEFGLDGFKVTESKKQAVFFKKDKSKTYDDIRKGLIEFRQFIKKFNLPHSFEVEKTITYTDKSPKLSEQQVLNQILEAENNV